MKIRFGVMQSFGVPDRCGACFYKKLTRAVAYVASGALTLGVTGCGIGPAASSVTAPVANVVLTGSVYGGSQPVSLATVQLYAVGTANGGASTPLLTTNVTTDTSGGFSIKGDFTCPSPSTPIYITATGGNPGFLGTVNNQQIALMAGLGACGGIGASTHILLNEVTTVGSLAALFPFASGYAAIGADSSNASLLNAAMTNIGVYTNVATGSAPGAALNVGYYASSNEINELANAIAACVNTSGGVAGDSSRCGLLFSLATPVGGSVPADTIGAVLNILKNPTLNVLKIYQSGGSQPPFQPTSANAPANWMLPIVATANPVTNVAVTGTSTANLGTNVQYAATVTGGANSSVVWQVNGVTGGSGLYGTISPAGLYVPPASVPASNTVTITAASLASATATGTEQVVVYNPVPVVLAASGSTTTYGQSFIVDVQGSGFVNGAALLVNGVPMATAAISLTDLQTTVTNTTGAAMQITVAVANPSPGATQSISSAVTLALPPATATAAARFLDQATFGPTAASIAHVQQIGLLAALTEQFNQPATVFTYPPNPDTECSSTTWRCTQSDWIKTVVTGNDQLRQRIAMALTEIWVAPNQNSGGMPYYLNVSGADAFTNYRTIMQDLALAPQMGYYLNMVNSGAAPTGQIPNENFGRELMQLLSMGLNALNQDGTPQLDVNGNTIPSYTETQVAAFAKAYTGWTYSNADGSKPTAFNGTAVWNYPMVAVESRHDTTAKTLLNGTTLPSGQTAEADLQGALNNIFADSNVPPFICKELIQHLVSGNPSPAYVQRVAGVFTNNGNGVRGDMQAVLTAILLDPEARAADTLTGDQIEALNSSTTAATSGHLREPLLFVPNLLRGLGEVQTNATDAYPFVGMASTQLQNMSEQPLNQSSVFNYFSPSYVIPGTAVNAPEFGLENTASVVPRLTVVDSLIHNTSGCGGACGWTVDMTATGVLGSKASTPATLVDYLGMVFMHSQMPTDMRTAIINEVTSIPATNLPERAEVATYLVLTSSQYKILF